MLEMLYHPIVKLNKEDLRTRRIKYKFGQLEGLVKGPDEEIRDEKLTATSKIEL